MYGIFYHKPTKKLGVKPYTDGYWCTLMYFNLLTDIVREKELQCILPLPYFITRQMYKITKLRKYL